MSNVFIRSQDREKLYCFGISFNSLQYSEEMEHKRGNKAEKHHAIYIADGCLEKIAEYESKYWMNCRKYAENISWYREALH